MRTTIACLALLGVTTLLAGCNDEPDASERCQQLAPGANRAANSYMDDKPIGDDFDPDQALSDYDDFKAFEEECMD